MVRIDFPNGNGYDCVLDREAVERYETGYESGIFELFNQIISKKRPKQVDLVRLLWATARAKNPQWSLELAAQLAGEPRAYARLFEHSVMLFNEALGEAPEPGKGQGGGSPKEIPFAGSSKPSDSAAG